MTASQNRAFTNAAWVAIFLMIGVVAFCMLITHLIMPRTKPETKDSAYSYKIMAFSIWIFFVFINAYYGGALTMFFTSTITIDFETRRDIFKAYPDWNLIFKDGKQIHFFSFVDQGDPDYVAYWARDQADQTDTRFGTIEEGLSRILSKQEIMFIGEPQLKGWLRANPFHVQVVAIKGNS